MDNILENAYTERIAFAPLNISSQLLKGLIHLKQ